MGEADSRALNWMRGMDLLVERPEGEACPWVLSGHSIWISWKTWGGGLGPSIFGWSTEILEDLCGQNLVEVRQVDGSSWKCCRMNVGHQLPHADQQRLHLDAVVDNNVDDLRSGYQKTLGHCLVEDPGLCHDLTWLSNIRLELGKKV